MRFFSVIFLLAGLSILQAQTTETDTLYYFDTDSLIASCYCPPIVLKQKNYAYCYAEDYAIYYEVNESIKSYYLKELHIQFVSDFENCYSHGPLPLGFEMYVRTGRFDSLPEHGIQLDSLPGEIVATIPITINDSTELYPNWKIINLDTFPNLRNLSGNFWIQGRPMSSSSWDTAFSSAGHTFVKEYYDYGLKWTTGPGIPNWAVSVVIENINLGLDDDLNKMPEMFQLYQNYPNPFNTQTIIGYSVFNQTKAFIVIYDILGKEIRTLQKVSQEAGINYVIWNGRDHNGREVPSGIYLYYLKADKGTNRVTAGKKLLLLR